MSGIPFEVKFRWMCIEGDFESGTLGQTRIVQGYSIIIGHWPSSFEYKTFNMTRKGFQSAVDYCDEIGSPAVKNPCNYTEHVDQCLPFVSLVAFEMLARISDAIARGLREKRQWIEDQEIWYPNLYKIMGMKL